MEYLNETLKTIAERRSIRGFTKEHIPLDKIKLIIKMATMAPSPMNNQPWKFIVILNKNIINEISTLVNNKISLIEDKVNQEAKVDYMRYKNNSSFFKCAPVLIVALLKPINRNAQAHYWGVENIFENESKVRGDIFTIGAACQNLILAAESLGVGSCVMHYPLIANEEISSILKIEKPWEIMTFIPMGIKKNSHNPAPKRREFSKVTRIIEE